MAPTDGFMKAPARELTPDGSPPPANGHLPHRLREELRSAQAAHMAAGPGRMIHTRIPLRLMERAKERAGIHSDEDLLHAALVHLVMEEQTRDH